MNCIILYVVKGVANYDWCTCVYYFIFLLQYGRIVDIELKIPSRPPCFCFVEVFLYNLASKKKKKSAVPFIRSFGNNLSFR